MTELEQAAYAWKQAAEGSRPGRHPIVWAGNFSDDRLLVALWATSDDYVRAGFYLGSVWAHCEHITDLFIICDRRRELGVSHLAAEGNGVRTTDWHIPYQIADNGEVSFSGAVQGWSKIQGMPAMLGMLGQRRLTGPKCSLTDALETAAALAEDL